LDSTGSGYDPMAGCWEHDNEISDSIKGRAFVNHLSEYQLAMG